MLSDSNRIDPKAAPIDVSRSAISRALLVLLFVVVLSSAVILFANEIAMGGVGLAMAIEGANADPEIWARFAISAAILLLAFAGARLFRQPFVVGDRGFVEKISAFPIGVLGVVGMLVTAWAHGVASQGAEAPIEASRFVIGGILILLAVAGEELLLRGLLQPLLVDAWGAVTGIGVTALAFMAVHVAGGWRDPVSLLNIFLAGIWFGLLAFRTGGLLAPTLAHFGWNWSEEMLFGASPNPGVGAFGSLTNIELAGPAIWGGAVEGLNASIALSIMLALFIAPLALLRVPRRQSEGALAAP